MSNNNCIYIYIYIWPGGVWGLGSDGSGPPASAASAASALRTSWGGIIRRIILLNSANLMQPAPALGMLLSKRVTVCLGGVCVGSRAVRALRPCRQQAILCRRWLTSMQCVPQSYLCNASMHHYILLHTPANLCRVGIKLMPKHVKAALRRGCRGSPILYNNTLYCIIIY